MFGLEGANAIEPTARSACVSETGLKLRPPSIERQMPPPEEPTRMRLEFAGEMAIAFTRPVAAPHGQFVSTGNGPIGFQTSEFVGSVAASSSAERFTSSRALRRP